MPRGRSKRNVSRADTPLAAKAPPRKPPAKRPMKSGHYEVEDLIDKKIEGGKVFYRVRWEGYTEADDTWEPKANIPKHLRDDYELKIKQASVEQQNGAKQADDTDAANTTDATDPPATANGAAPAEPAAKKRRGRRPKINDPPEMGVARKATGSPAPAAANGSTSGAEPVNGTATTGIDLDEHMSEDEVRPADNGDQATTNGVEGAKVNGVVNGDETRVDEEQGDSTTEEVSDKAVFKAKVVPLYTADSDTQTDIELLMSWAELNYKCPKCTAPVVDVVSLDADTPPETH